MAKETAQAAKSSAAAKKTKKEAAPIRPRSIPPLAAQALALGGCVGVDEAGRGPLAGPVCAAAALLPEGYELPGLRDSKKVPEKKRDALAAAIRRDALAWRIEFADCEEIDRLNILGATMAAMARAVLGLGVDWDCALIDGNRIPKALEGRSIAVVKGDELIPAISAASLLAKTARDAAMRRLDRRFPQYGFAKHKGYGTKAHLQALREFGPTCAHRASFSPVKEILAGQDAPENGAAAPGDNASNGRGA